MRRWVGLVGRAGWVVAIALVLVALLASSGGPTAAVGDRTATPAAPPPPPPLPSPDLAAMTLFPADLGLLDFAYSWQYALTVDDLARPVDARWGDLDPHEAATAAELAALGVRGGVETVLEQAGRREPDYLDPRIVLTSSVVEVADSAGAAAAYELIEAVGDLPQSRDLPPTRRLGDRSDVTVTDLPLPRPSTDAEASSFDQRGDVWSVEDEADPIPPVEEVGVWIEVSFRVGNLFGAVSVQDHSDQPLDVAAVELLATALLERIGAVQAGPPTVVGLPLRLDLDAPAGWPGYYARRDGRDVPQIGESPSYRRLRARERGDATDVFGVFQSGEDSEFTYSTTLYRFSNAAAASAWLAAADHSTGVPGWAVARLPSAPSAGDESSTFASAPGESMATAVVLVRVDRHVSVIQLVESRHRDGPSGAWRMEGEPPLDAIAAIAAAQVACLRAGACPEPLAVPQSLLETGR